MHALRVCCRIHALNTIHMTRLDAEGAKDIDPEASSQKPWKNWTAHLKPEEKLALEIWRSGAVKTPTRLRSGEPCRFCAHPYPSSRHWWAECPGLAEQRFRIGFNHGIPAEWWCAQPRVTAKTGWITYGAAATPGRRSELQVAACELGIEILASSAEWASGASQR